MGKLGRYFFGSPEKEIQKEQPTIEVEQPELEEIRTAVDASPDDYQELITKSADLAMSEEAKARKRKMTSIRGDLTYFDEQMTKAEIFAVKSRENFKKLKDFLHESEMELDQVDDLKAELRDKGNEIKRLSERTVELRTALSEKDAKLISEEARLVETRDMLERARGETTGVVEQLSDSENEVRDLKKSKMALEAANAQAAARLVDLEAENHIFNDMIERHTKEITAYSNSNRELEKRVAELEKYQNALKNERDRLSGVLMQREDRISKMVNIEQELRSSNENLREEVASKDRHSADKLRSREDEIYSLKSEVDTLQSQLSVRTQMFNQGQQDMNSAKAMAKVAKDSAEEMEARLVQNNMEIEQLRRKLMESNEEISELNARYSRVLKDLEQTKRENSGLQRIQKFHDEQARRMAGLDVKSEEEIDLDLESKPPDTSSH